LKRCIPLFCLLSTAGAHSSQDACPKSELASCLVLDPFDHFDGKPIVPVRVGTRAFEDFQIKYLASRIIKNETLSPERAQQKAQQILFGCPYQQYPIEDVKYQDPEYNNEIDLQHSVTYGAHEEQSLKVLMNAYNKVKPASHKVDAVEKNNNKSE